MIAPVTHILPLTLIRRARMLPGKGRVLVRVGQKVSATDVIAETTISGEHVLVDVREALGLHSASQAQRLIDRKAGERIEKGDILAQTGGLFARVIRAPVDGQLIAVHRGQILLEKKGRSQEILAGINGVIAEVLPDRGAIIETHGALIQGVWGNNLVNLGLLAGATSIGMGELTRASLDVTFRGGIVMAGYITNPDALQVGEELPLRGLILGSMSSDLIEAAQRVHYPIILLEGFGRTPVNSAALNLLTTHFQRDVCMDASWDAQRGDVRPEIVIPLPASGHAPNETPEFTNGKTVRIHVPPLAGQVGTFMALRPGLTRLPNGQRVPAADVAIENAQVVTVPLANMDVLE
jgi:hypothetical protein